MKKLFATLVALLLSSLAFAAVNINTATVDELQALPGVGPARAQAIVDYRQQNGNFKKKEDLKQVSGIGDKVYADLESKISLSGATRITWDNARKADEPAKNTRAKADKGNSSKAKSEKAEKAEKAEAEKAEKASNKKS